MASMWPGLFWLCALNAAFVVVGSPVVAGGLDLAVPDLFVYGIFLVVVSMPLTTLAGLAHDVRRAARPARRGGLARRGQLATARPTSTAQTPRSGPVMVMTQIVTGILLLAHRFVHLLYLAPAVPESSLEGRGSSRMRLAGRLDWA